MQEYFASVELNAQGIGRFLGKPSLIVPPAYIFSAGISINLKWDEIIVAACGIANDPDECIKQLVLSNPFLAARCVENGVKLLPESNRRVVGRLLDLAKSYFVDDIRASAILHLGRIADKNASTTIIELLEDQSPRIREASVVALDSLKDANSIDSLGKILNNESEYGNTSQWAADALGGIGDKRATPYLMKALDDSRWFVREAAVDALFHINDISTFDKLKEVLMKDEVGRVRSIAAIVLGKVGGPKAIPSLVECLSDEDKEVQWAICEALTDIETPEALAAVEKWKQQQNET